MEIMKRETHKVDIFIQARENSTRFPKKILKKISKKSILEIILERISMIKNTDNIVLVTGPEQSNSSLAKEANRLGIDVFFGEEENILDRFWNAAKHYKSNYIIRITGDCPLLDFDLVNKGIEIFFSDKKIDLLTNTKKRTYPHGFDFEIFTGDSLRKSWEKVVQNLEDSKKKFINPVEFILNSGKFEIFSMEGDIDQSNIRLTIDYPEDLELISIIYEKLNLKKQFFSSDDIIEFLEKNPESMKINEKY
tara:strand:- start:76 stop:825 length:750 start_codon:yes stop_codon:yes gene_type:complete